MMMGMRSRNMTVDLMQSSNNMRHKRGGMKYRPSSKFALPSQKERRSGFDTLNSESCSEGFELNSSNNTSNSIDSTSKSVQTPLPLLNFVRVNDDGESSVKNQRKMEKEEKLRNYFCKEIDASKSLIKIRKGKILKNETSGQMSVLNYKLASLIGQGSFAAVYKGIDIETDEIRVNER